MREAKWLACRDWRAMLDYLEGNASERKLRLFACACCRLIWDLLVDERCRKAVEVAERFADRLTGRRQVVEAVYQLLMDRRGQDPREAAERFADRLVGPEELTDARHAAESVDDEAACAARGTTGDHAWGCALVAADEVSEENQWLRPELLCDVLRDIFGNPFRVTKVERGWLSWHDGVVPKVAQAIYDERRFGDLPILADTLEEAGCDNPDILGHCRGPGEHYRGCWVVDLLLGRT